MLRISLIMILAALSLAGCKDDPFKGRWFSADTGASFVLEDGGECRYTNDAGLGIFCEWEASSEKRAVLRLKKGRNFVDMQAEIIGDQLFLDIPPNRLDIFRKDGA